MDASRHDIGDGYLLPGRFMSIRVHSWQCILSIALAARLERLAKQRASRQAHHALSPQSQAFDQRAVAFNVFAR